MWSQLNKNYFKFTSYFNTFAHRMEKFHSKKLFVTSNDFFQQEAAHETSGRFKLVLSRPSNDYHKNLHTFIRTNKDANQNIQWSARPNKFSDEIFRAFARLWSSSSSSAWWILISREIKKLPTQRENFFREFQPAVFQCQSKWALQLALLTKLKITNL